MAGKKKNTNVPQSKTARASAGKKKEEGFQASGDMNRIVSLAGGEFAYVLDPRSGRTYHLRVGSSSWELMISGLLDDAKHGERIRAEVVKLGFPLPGELDEAVL